MLAGGTVDPAFAPNVTGGPVTTLARGSAALFAGGAFTSIDGGGREGFAALNATTGAVIALPSTTFSGALRARKVLIAGSALIVIAPQTFSFRVFAFNQTNGATTWSAVLGHTRFPTRAANDAVTGGSRLIVGGDLVHPDGGSLASLDIATGAIDMSWSPSPGPLSPVSGLTVQALAVSNGTLFVGGKFTAFGGQLRANAAAVDIATGGVTMWAPNPSGVVTTMAASADGTLFLGGAFAQVSGQAREKIAEVDAAGVATAWTSNAHAGAVRALRVETAGTLIVGGHVAVAGGSARTNLAAFDLSTNTLLPWAPATEDDILELAATGGSIFVGSLRTVPTPTLKMAAVFALDAVSGAVLPWTPPHADNHVRLLGTHDGRVYLTVITENTSRLVRVDAATGALDESWRPAVSAVQMAVSGNTMYVANGSQLRAVDLTSGALLPWSPQYLPPFQFPPNVQIRGLATDGRTVYAAIELTGPNIAGVLAFDGVTALRTGGGTSIPFLEGSMGAIAVADGQLLVSRSTSLFQIPPPIGSGLASYSANGAQTPWNPRYSRIDIDREFAPSEIVVTPTDVIVVGQQAAAPVPVQGIAVLPRTPSLAPKSLRAATAGQQVTLTWDPPATPPGGGYIVDVASEPGSPTPLSVPTGSQATTLTGVVSNGTYYVRVRAAGAPAGAASVPTNEIGIIVGCDGPPPAPANLAAQVSGGQVTVSWTPSPGATRYVLEAGTFQGSSNIGTFTLGASTSSVTGTVGLGVQHFVRLRAGNACGNSDASTEISFMVGEPLAPAPTGLTTQVSRSSVTVQWTASPGAISYEVTVDSAPGGVRLATFMTSATSFSVNNVPKGTYILFVRARNTSGFSVTGTGTVVTVN